MAPQITTGAPVNSAPVFVDPQEGPGKMYQSEVPILVNGIDRGHYIVQFFMPDSMTNAEAAAILANGMSVRWR